MGALLLGVVLTAGLEDGLGVEAVAELPTGGLGFGAEELVALLAEGVVVAATTGGLAAVAGLVPEEPETTLLRHQVPLLLSSAHRST